MNNFLKVNQGILNDIGVKGKLSWKFIGASTIMLDPGEHINFQIENRKILKHGLEKYSCHAMILP